MENILKSELDLKVCEQIEGSPQTGGYICQSKLFHTDKYGKIFVKFYGGATSRRMFEGEYESLQALKSTNSITVPNPISVLDIPNEGSALALEFIEMQNLMKFQGKLGEELARLHLCNPDLSCEHSNKFGFHVNACYGHYPVDNSWKDDWISFFTQQRMEPQIKLVLEKYGNREVIELWSQLQLVIPNFFKGLSIKPSLLHGDLWLGNVGETINGPVVYDPSSFWGHNEFDLSIGKLFGGFHSSFYSAYHHLIPQEPGFQARQMLYVLFHLLNHWNHFGDSYKEQTISIMKILI